MKLTYSIVAILGANNGISIISSLSIADIKLYFLAELLKYIGFLLFFSYQLY